jgi:Chalcone isomerase-like
MFTRTKRSLLALIGSALIASPFAAIAQTSEVGGVAFEQAADVKGKRLLLNGAGVRYKAVFKVYAVGLYLPVKTTTAKAVFDMQGPKRIHAVMLRDVGGVELGKNFTRHFEDNASREEFTASISQIFRFGELFAGRKQLKAGDSFTLDWVPGFGTVVSINGVPQGEPYAGAGFFNGMLKLWVGEHDSAGVRAALLGQEISVAGRDSYR